MKHIYSFFFFLIVTITASAQLQVPSELQDYYGTSAISTDNPGQLESFLKTLTTEKHTNQLFYGQRHDFLYDADANLSNDSEVVLMYSGETRDEREYMSGNNSYSPQTFNTEHIWPQSLLFGGIFEVARADMHHLRACDDQVNSDRSNNPYAKASAGNTSGTYENLTDSWFPGDEWKGDVARMALYVNLRYDEPFVDIGTLELFLEWNVEDPVSDFELQRNTVITNAQGNRNPFIDNPFLATAIWGGDDAENRWSTLSVEGPSENNIRLFPNPANGNSVTILSNKELAVEVFDILGKKVSAQTISSNQRKLNISTLKSGIYLVRLKSNESTETRKLIVR